MKPAPFDYVAPTSLEEAVGRCGIDCSRSCDGQGSWPVGRSLVPLLNFRVTRPSVVVDLAQDSGRRCRRTAAGGFEAVARRFGDFALGCIAVSLERRGDRSATRASRSWGSTRPRVALVKRRPCCATRQARRPISSASRRRCEWRCSPPSDIHVSSDYRRALIGLLAERVTAAAWTRAAEERSEPADRRHRQRTQLPGERRAPPVAVRLSARHASVSPEPTSDASTAFVAPARC